MAAHEGFEALYRLRYGPLAAQLYAYLGDAAEAEDVVQEAFLRAWRRWDAVSTYEDPVAWVRKVAWNLATSRWRHLVTAARVGLRLVVRAEPESVRPDHVALVAGLQRIPDRYRRVLVLHYIADLPVAEVAAELGVPKGTVLSWLHRGRRELAAHVDPAAAAEADEEPHVESGAS